METHTVYVSIYNIVETQYIIYCIYIIKYTYIMNTHYRVHITQYMKIPHLLFTDGWYDLSQPAWPVPTSMAQTRGATRLRDVKVWLHKLGNWFGHGRIVIVAIVIMALLLYYGGLLLQLWSIIVLILYKMFMIIVIYTPKVWKSGMLIPPKICQTWILGHVCDFQTNPSHSSLISSEIEDATDGWPW